MDEFFDRIKDGAFRVKDGAELVAREVAKRTAEAITHTKLSFAINQAQSKIKDVYTEIGESLYAQHVEGTDLDESLVPYFEQLDKLNDEIDSLNSKRAEIKNSLQCSECGALNPKDSAFCSKCGSKFEPKATDADDINETIIDDDDDEEIIIEPKRPEED